MNVQKEIIELYGSDSLCRSAAGVWLKLSYEFLVVTIPIGIICLVLGVFHPSIEITMEISSTSASTLWGSMSLTVTGIVWCFSLTTIEVEEDNEGSAVSYSEDNIESQETRSNLETEDREDATQVEEVEGE